MTGRRGRGEDSIYFDHSGDCRGPETHRHCPGRWRGVVSLKPGPDGQRRRKKVSGKTKTEVRAKLAELHDELNDGVVTNAGYTVAQAIRDWLADGLAGRAPKTVSTQREVLEPLIGIIGAVPLRELTAATVRSALKELAATRATRKVAMAHAGLTRAIRHAEANDKVRRNVATLVDTPTGREGRPSKSLTFGQAVALVEAARSHGLYAYVVLSLLVGVRTEEARALRWDHVDLDGDLNGDPPVPPHVDVWRSVRVHGDTKTRKSRRSLGLPRMAVEALGEQLQRQATAAAGRRSLARQRARLHDSARDSARCRGCAPVAPDHLPESRPRRGVDATRAAPHLCLSAVRQRDGHRGDQPPRRPQFIERHRDGLPPPDPAGHHRRGRGDGQDLRQRALTCRAAVGRTPFGPVRAG